MNGSKGHWRESLLMSVALVGLTETVLEVLGELCFPPASGCPAAYSPSPGLICIRIEGIDYSIFT